MQLASELVLTCVVCVKFAADAGAGAASGDVASGVAISSACGTIWCWAEVQFNCTAFLWVVNSNEQVMCWVSFLTATN